MHKDKVQHTSKVCWSSSLLCHSGCPMMSYLCPLHHHIQCHIISDIVIIETYQTGIMVVRLLLLEANRVFWTNTQDVSILYPGSSHLYPFPFLSEWCCSSKTSECQKNVDSMPPQAEPLQTTCQSCAVSVGSLVSMTGPDAIPVSKAHHWEQKFCMCQYPTAFHIHRKSASSTMFNLDLIFNGNLL